MNALPSTVPPTDETRELPVFGWLRALRRRWRAASLAVLAGIAVAAALTAMAAKSYSAIAEVYFREDAISQAATGQFAQTAPASTQNPTTILSTNLRLATLPKIAQRAAIILGSPYTRQEVSEKISVAPEGQSDIVSITATNPRPSEAARIANAYASAFLAERRQDDSAVLLRTVHLLQQQSKSLPLAQRNGSRGQLLTSHEQELTVLASLQTGQAELAQPAIVPVHPSSPNPIRDVLLGLVAGLVLAAVAVGVREQLDRRIRDPEEANSLFARPLLGIIPKLDGSVQDQSGPARDSFHLILAHLRYFNTSDEVRVVMVTSAQSGDGKTTLAWHLAHAASSTGRKTILVEADLRRPVLSGRYDLPRKQTLSDVLVGFADWRDAICRVSLNGSTEAGASLDVLPASMVPNPEDLIGSDHLLTLLETLRDEYDFVVVDSAPPTMVPESLPLLMATDGIIAVVRANRSMRAANELLRDQLREMNGRLLGVVVNDVVLSRMKYGPYGYEYATHE